VKFSKLALLTLCVLGLISGSLAQPKPRVQEQQITYLSGALRIKARVFWPVGKGPFPAIVFNHGGVTGISKGTIKRCAELAQAGFAVFASSYRGEDGSDGQVEVAKGEVNDALAGLAWLQANPRVDPRRIAIGGTSHGAAVSLLAAARTNQFRSLVFMYGVSDLYAWYAYLQRTNQLSNDQLTRQTYGDGPQDQPESFKIRNVLSGVDRLPPRMPTLILQGGADTIVPPEQAVVLRDALNRSGRPVTLKVYPKSPHGFFNNRDIEIRSSPARGQASVDAFNTVVGFLRQTLR
jgi:dipeptidyl aminopeptidase/acylaminoacyl peptidase